jgi:hypothetical protein
MRVRILSFILVLLVGILSCAPLNLVGENPVVISDPSATPFIADSYPTAEADLNSPNKVISGIDVRVERAWLDGKQVYADVCYTMPDSSDWTIWKASLRYADVVVLEYGATLLSLQEPGLDGQPGQRCDRLEFYVPPDAEITTVTVSLEALGAYPREEDYCTIYMPKIQQSLNERGIAIALACNEVDGKQTMQIVSVPDTMSQEDAEQLVYSDEFFTVKGPWEFTFDLIK